MICNFRHSSFLEDSQLLSLQISLPPHFVLPSPFWIFSLYPLHFLLFMHFPSFCLLVFHSDSFLLMYFLVHYVSSLLRIQSSGFIALVTMFWNSRHFIGFVFIFLWFFILSSIFQISQDCLYFLIINMLILELVS